MGDADERLEETSRHKIDMNQEPYEGMLFDSEEAAKALYDDYARQMGFLTRILSSRKSERDGSVISRGIGCRGGSDGRRKGKIHVQDNQQEGCKAMILLKREKPGRWVVKKFFRDHNHPLVAQLTTSSQKLDEKDKKIQELTTELRIKKRLRTAYREQLLTFMKDVEDHNDHLSTKVQLILDNLKKLEAERQDLLQHK